MAAPRIHPVILSGGSGTRLWPMSRTAYPKQLMPLVSERTMLQETVIRVGPTTADAAVTFAPPLVVCNDEHRFMVAEQLRQVGVAPAGIVLEPVGRNTAPAAAVAALILLRGDPEALMLMLPSDHHVADAPAFRAAVAQAAAAAIQGALVTFGVAADRPETGYGYIRRGAPLNAAPGCFRVDRFVEKPDLETARAYVQSGDYDWNSGMFLFRAGRLVEELETHAPEVLAAARAALGAARADLDFLRLDKAAFGAAPSLSIDYAVMEKTEGAAVCPVDIGWTDVGSWAALWEIAAKDEHGNALIGDVIANDLSGCYVRADGRLVAAVGLKDVILVDTADAVLVVARDRAQDLRQLVDRIREARRSEHLQHRRVYRPWGSYEGVDLGERHQVKRIIVKPGGRLSLQRHAHRAEHWIVVKGSARVTRDRDVFDLHENQSTYIPLGAVHRLENVTDEPLHLIEVQSGGYLGEDDIVRLEDTYGRG
ncbi:MAG: mannose-1-phosphate guanylyltransferase/mannose-6-phosphate isomerase [Rhodospirillaceae bacterium]|nr:mannose-1-phosphate guanylyltransferase/mannose-6-phosphate isomerase [Rhodospirillaceae bacterium]